MVDIDYFKHHILPLKTRLFRKALSVTGSPDEAQDVAQDVMVRLWENRAKWPEIVNMEVYAMVLARNMALDRVKKGGRGYAPAMTRPQAVAADDTHLPSDDLERGERVALVWRVIEQLPEEWQKVVRLREIEELSYRQIAEELNLTEANVKITLFRARRRMKEIILKTTSRNEY